ncbi:MAG: cupin domain-containing protein [Clostridia bacterium]|nr:cupin domain-containing protein [Clostridia bacterium]MBR0188946.1 cupin domain-containing protein [Clostridia bacterium]
MEEQNIINSGDKPTLLNLNNVARSNRFYRKEIWTGEYLQLTVMSIPIGGEVGLEIHNENDQMIGVEYGFASVYTGATKQGVKFMGNVNSDYAIFIPAGTWHNIINDGNVPLKLYSVYAPPHHPKGTVHKTKFDSDLADY